MSNRKIFEETLALYKQQDDPKDGYWPADMVEYWTPATRNKSLCLEGCLFSVLNKSNIQCEYDIGAYRQTPVYEELRRVLAEVLEINLESLWSYNDAPEISREEIENALHLAVLKEYEVEKKSIDNTIQKLKNSVETENELEAA